MTLLRETRRLAEGRRRPLWVSLCLPCGQTYRLSVLAVAISLRSWPQEGCGARSAVALYRTSRIARRSPCRRSSAWKSPSLFRLPSGFPPSSFGLYTELQEIVTLRLKLWEASSQALCGGALSFPALYHEGAVSGPFRGLLLYREKCPAHRKQRNMVFFVGNLAVNA